MVLWKVFVFLLLIIVPYSFFRVRPWLILFNKYCDRVAEIENRIGERRSNWNRDDGGMNRFEREHIWKLWRKHYRNYSDAELVVMGKKLGDWRLVLVDIGVVITMILWMVSDNK